MSGSAIADEYRSFRERGAIVDLSPRTQILFRGADRIRFLNGQVTANIARAAVPSVTPACVTTAKGKLCAVGFVSLSPDAALFDTELEHVDSDALVRRFLKYVVADEVQVADVTLTVNNIHLCGVAIERVPPRLRPALVPVNRFGIAGHDLLTAFDGAEHEAWDELAGLFHAPSFDLLNLISIERGVPRWGFDLDENTLPAEAALDRTHVDFHKGCYIGQEVISRLRSVGHVNRELRGFVSTDGAPLTAGARIFSAADPARIGDVANPAREIGRITSAAFSFALDRPVALGYLRRDAVGAEFLAAAPDAPDAPVKITLHPLPFVP